MNKEANEKYLRMNIKGEPKELCSTNLHDTRSRVRRRGSFRDGVEIGLTLLSFTLA
jgi:hypothetical protein